VRWLNPSLLYLLPLAAVPLLLHFLLRERVQKVVFTALRFLRQQGHDALVRHRWVEWLLTGVRVALVALLVVAFARPFFQRRGEAARASGERPMVVVMLDTSRSMTFRSRFADAQAEAERLVRNAGDAQALKIVTFADEGHVALLDPPDVSDALDEVRRAKPSAYGTDVLAAVDRVFAAVASHPAGGEVHLISDLQANGFARQRDVRSVPKGFSFHVHAVGGERVDDAIAVAGGALSTEVTPEAENVAVSARVINRGKTREVEAKLLVDDRPLASRRIALPPNGEAVVSLSATVRELGDHKGQVVIAGAPVALQGDDRLNFVVRVVPRIHVAVVNGHPSAAPEGDAAFYLVKALNAGKDTPIQATAQASLPPLKDTDVVVLASVGALPAADRERLAEFVRRGGGLLIALGPGMDPGKFNEGAGQLAPARLRGWRAADRGAYLAEADLKHPLIQRVAADGSGDLTTARFNGSCELKDSQDARVVLRFDDHRPALLEKREGAGTVLLFAAALDRRGGDFPLRAIFVPFVRESIKLLSARGERSGTLALGESLPAPAGGEVEYPDGSIVRGDGAAWTVSQPGFYRVRTKGKTELYAANVDPAESDLTAAAASDIESLFRPAKDAKDWEVRHTARGYELVLAAAGKLKAERRWNIGWWCLVALVGLCAIELWLAQVASRK